MFVFEDKLWVKHKPILCLLHTLYIVECGVCIKSACVSRLLMSGLKMRGLEM